MQENAIQTQARADQHERKSIGAESAAIKLTIIATFTIGLVGCQTTNAAQGSVTKHSVVTNRIGIRPGDHIDLQELEDSERRLGFSQIFETNPTQGEPPRIEVGSPDNPQADRY